MNTKQLITSSLFKFNQLKDAKKTSFWKTILYLIALSVILALPLAYQVGQVIHDIQKDGQKIAKKIPNFEIVDGKLATDDADGFIYQTNSIIFTFDPQGKRTEEDITNDLIGNFVSVGLLEDKAVLALPSSGITSSLFGSNELAINYTSEPLSSLTGTDVRAMLNQTTLPLFLKIMILLVSIYPTFLNLLITVFMASLGGLIYARLRMNKITFFETLKIMVYAVTLPTLIATVLYFLLPSFDTSLFITLAGLFIFIQTIKDPTPIS